MNFYGAARLYAAQCRWYARAHRGEFSVLEALTDFLKWFTSQGSTALNDQQPWLTFGAIRFLKARISPNWKVFEFGVGGSTAFFVRQGANLISVEHETEWASRLQVQLQGVTNWRLYTVALSDVSKHEPDNSGNFISARYAIGVSFKSYVEVIEQYPGESFDIILVDGRVRNACIKYSYSKVRPGGLIILDDSERSDYQGAIDFLAAVGWQRQDFCGPAPYVNSFKCTTIWRRPG